MQHTYRLVSRIWPKLVSLESDFVYKTQINWNKLAKPLPNCPKHMLPKKYCSRINQHYAGKMKKIYSSTLLLLHSKLVYSSQHKSQSRTSSSRFNYPLQLNHCFGSINIIQYSSIAALAQSILRPKSKMEGTAKTTKTFSSFFPFL